jgi:hypothetical protein
LFGAFFLLEILFGSGTSLIQIGGQRHLLFKELGELYSKAHPRQLSDATPTGAQTAVPVRRKDACKAAAVLGVHMADLYGAEEAKLKAAPWWIPSLSVTDPRFHAFLSNIAHGCNSMVFLLPVGLRWAIDASPGAQRVALQ